MAIAKKEVKRYSTMNKNIRSNGAENRKIKILVASGIAAFVVGIGVLTVGLVILPFIALMLGGAIAFN